MSPITIKLFDSVGSFAENKDLAQQIRKNIIIPALDSNQHVILNFEKIDSATQSFIHALISDLFRNYDDILDKISFQSCNNTVKKIIEIVIDYMLES